MDAVAQAVERVECAQSVCVTSTHRNCGKRMRLAQEWLATGSAGCWAVRMAAGRRTLIATQLARMLATQSFFSLSDAWLRLSMLENWRGCTGDSGSPNLLGLRT